MKLSLSKRHIALSATCKWDPAMHLTILLKSLVIRGFNLSASQNSKTSGSSWRKRVSLTKLAKGQYFKIPSRRGIARLESLVRKSMEQRMRLSKYTFEVWTLWRGMMIFLKKTTCSSIKGTAKPEIIEARISRSSDAPLNLWISWIRMWKQSVIAFLIIFLLGTNLAYNLWRMFFKKSLSSVSSESKSWRN